MFAIREPTSVFPIILFLHLPPLNTLPGDFFWSVALLLINIWAKKSGLGEISSHWLLFQSLTWWVCDSHWWQDRSRCVVTHPWLTSLWHGWRAGGHEQMHDDVQQHRNAESSIQQRGQVPRPLPSGALPGFFYYQLVHCILFMKLHGCMCSGGDFFVC